MPESQHSGTSSGNIFTWGPTTQGLCHVVRLLEIIQKNVIFECMENVHKRTSAVFEGFCGFSKELAWSSHRAAVGLYINLRQRDRKPAGPRAGHWPPGLCRCTQGFAAPSLPNSAGSAVWAMRRGNELSFSLSSQPMSL